LGFLDLVLCQTVLTLSKFDNRISDLRKIPYTVRRMTEPEPLQQIDRTYVRLRNRKLVYFSGCDYFRLASHHKIIAALQSGVEKYGLNVAASRLTTGNHRLYRELEKRLADFFQS